MRDSDFNKCMALAEERFIETLDAAMASEFADLYHIDPGHDSLARIQHDPKLTWLFPDKKKL